VIGADWKRDVHALLPDDMSLSKLSITTLETSESASVNLAMAINLGLLHIPNESPGFSSVDSDRERAIRFDLDSSFLTVYSGGGDVAPEVEQLTPLLRAIEIWFWEHWNRREFPYLEIDGPLSVWGGAVAEADRAMLTPRGIDRYFFGLGASSRTRLRLAKILRDAQPPLPIEPDHPLMGGPTAAAHSR